MAFLRALFWIVLTVVVVVFSMRNWEPLDINLFGNLVWQTKRPVPLLLAFLLGFGPLYAWHRATRWRDRQKRVAAEHALAAATVVHPATPAPPPAPAFGSTLPDGTAPARAD